MKHLGSAAGHASLQIICQVGEEMTEYLELLETRRKPSLLLLRCQNK